MGAQLGPPTGAGRVALKPTGRFHRPLHQCLVDSGIGVVVVNPRRTRRGELQPIVLPEPYNYGYSRQARELLRMLAPGTPPFPKQQGNRSARDRPEGYSRHPLTRAGVTSSPSPAPSTPIWWGSWMPSASRSGPPRTLQGCHLDRSDHRPRPNSREPQVGGFSIPLHGKARSKRCQPSRSRRFAKGSSTVRASDRPLATTPPSRPESSETEP